MRTFSGRSRPRRKQLKQRKTFTLSQDSITLLEELCARRGAGHRESVSAVLDEVLQAVAEAQRRHTIESATTAYYDGRSATEEREESDWAQFALSQMIADAGTFGESK